MAEQKKLLNDVVIIRPLAIFLLVVWHSFIIYTGGWSAPAGYMPIEGYWWLAKASYAFMLELFVFISGYVFCLSLQKKNPSFKNVVVGKFRRLIVPSIIFSLIYYFLFYDLAEFSVRGFIMNILNGCGHMWFLPMLFWTTLIAYLLNAIKCSDVVKVVIALGMVVLSFLPIPLRISSAFYYTFFFYIGMVMYKNKDVILSVTCNRLIYSLLLGGGDSVYCGNNYRQRCPSSLYCK